MTTHCLRPHLRLFLLCCLPLGLWQCAAHLRTVVATSLLEDMVAATNQQDDLDLVVQATPGYLLLLEGLRQGDPDNRHLLTSLARAYASYATLVEIDSPERAGPLYRSGQGLRAPGPAPAEASRPPAGSSLRPIRPHPHRPQPTGSRNGLLDCPELGGLDRLPP